MEGHILNKLYHDYTINKLCHSFMKRQHQVDPKLKSLVCCLNSSYCDAVDTTSRQRYSFGQLILQLIDGNCKVNQECTKLQRILQHLRDLKDHLKSVTSYQVAVDEIYKQMAAEWYIREGQNAVKVKIKELQDIADETEKFVLLKLESCNLHKEAMHTKDDLHRALVPIVSELCPDISHITSITQLFEESRQHSSTKDETTQSRYIGTQHEQGTQHEPSSGSPTTSSSLSHISPTPRHERWQQRSSSSTPPTNPSCLPDVVDHYNRSSYDSSSSAIPNNQLAWMQSPKNRQTHLHSHSDPQVHDSVSQNSQNTGNNKETAAIQKKTDVQEKPAMQKSSHDQSLSQDVISISSSQSGDTTIDIHNNCNDTNNSSFNEGIQAIASIHAGSGSDLDVQALVLKRLQLLMNTAPQTSTNDLKSAVVKSTIGMQNELFADCQQCMPSRKCSSALLQKPQSTGKNECKKVRVLGKAQISKASGQKTVPKESSTVLVKNSTCKKLSLNSNVAKTHGTKDTQRKHNESNKVKSILLPPSASKQKSPNASSKKVSFSQENVEVTIPKAIASEQNNATECKNSELAMKCSTVASAEKKTKRKMTKHHKKHKHGVEDGKKLSKKKKKKLKSNDQEKEIRGNVLRTTNKENGNAHKKKNKSKKKKKLQLLASDVDSKEIGLSARKHKHKTSKPCKGARDINDGPPNRSEGASRCSLNEKSLHNSKNTSQHLKSQSCRSDEDTQQHDIVVIDSSQETENKSNNSASVDEVTSSTQQKDSSSSNALVHDTGSEHNHVSDIAIDNVTGVNDVCSGAVNNRNLECDHESVVSNSNIMSDSLMISSSSEENYDYNSIVDCGDYDSAYIEWINDENVSSARNGKQLASDEQANDYHASDGAQNSKLTTEKNQDRGYNAGAEQSDINSAVKENQGGYHALSGSEALTHGADSIQILCHSTSNEQLENSTEEHLDDQPGVSVNKQDTTGAIGDQCEELGSSMKWHSGGNSAASDEHQNELLPVVSSNGSSEVILGTISFLCNANENNQYTVDSDSTFADLVIDTDVESNASGGYMRVNGQKNSSFVTNATSKILGNATDGSSLSLQSHVKNESLIGSQGTIVANDDNDDRVSGSSNSIHENLNKEGQILREQDSDDADTGSVVLPLYSSKLIKRPVTVLDSDEFSDDSSADCFAMPPPKKFSSPTMPQHHNKTSMRQSPAACDHAYSNKSRSAVAGNDMYDFMSDSSEMFTQITNTKRQKDPVAKKKKKSAHKKKTKVPVSEKKHEPKRKQNSKRHKT